MTDILVVDDDENMRQALAEALTRAGYRVETAADASAGMMKLEMGEFRLVVSDLRMPKKNGLEFLDEIKALRPALPVVLITAYGAMETAVEAMRRGAADYLLKPFSADTLEKTVKRLLEGEGGESAKAAAPARPAVRATRAKERPIVTKNKKMLEMLEMAERTAASRASVLIQGESGTGKELLARFIHQKSDRAQGPFVAINCAAIPETLLESELFGHEKGAFTGAMGRKAGKFELADGGTILLDEISEMDTALQAKLLRVLQEREIDRVGGSAPVAVDVRVVATTNRRMEEFVRAGKFREDLYFRLNVIPLVIPPLRDRQEDIQPLAEYFTARFAAEAGKNVTGLTAEAMDILQKCRWRGNIRELENVMERAVLLARGEKVGPADLFMLPAGDEPASAPPDLPREMPHAAAPYMEPGMTVEEMERRLIFGTLDKAGNNRTKAADMLGISIRTLRNKLNAYKTDVKGQSS